MPLSSKQTFGAQLRALQAAVLANHGADDRIVVGKTSYTPEELSAKIDAYLAVQAQTVVAKNGYHLAVSNETASNADARAFRDQVQGYVIAQHGKSDTILLQYGFGPARPKRTTAAVQAVAVVKRRATRKARGTMGKKAKAKIKGVVDPAIEQALTAASTPVREVPPEVPR
jgi:hypothetical protein